MFDVEKCRFCSLNAFFTMAKNAIHVSNVVTTKEPVSHAVKHEIIYAQSCLNFEFVGMYLKSACDILRFLSNLTFSTFTSLMSSAAFTSCDHCT